MKRATVLAWISLAAAGLFIVPGFAGATDRPLTDVARPDGTQIIAYVDREPGSGAQGVILIAQGSGCGSVRDNPNIQRAKSLLLPEFAALTVEDYGVGPGDADRIGEEKCPSAFYERHTISQRASDVLTVLARLRREPWWNGELVLFGGSEGGAVVQELAPLTSARAVVVYSSATGLKFRAAFVQVLPPGVAAQARTALEDVRTHPDSSKVLMGNSYRWWADIMDRRLSDDLLRAAAPILVVQGEKDQSNPAASARAVRDAFAAAGRCNLTYQEFAGYDHHMVDAAGRDHFVEVMNGVSAWLRRRLSEAKAAAC